MWRHTKAKDAILMAGSRTMVCARPVKAVGMFELARRRERKRGRRTSGSVIMCLVARLTVEQHQ
jgi:hypothetical protein